MLYYTNNKEIKLAHKKYITLEEIVEALNTGKLKRRSVSQMIQYYKRKGDLQSTEMYKEALLLTNK